MLGNLHNRPMLGRIGPWVIASYGPAMGLTFFLGFSAALCIDAYTGQDPLTKLEFYLFVTFPMILLGARAASVLLEWRELKTAPLQTLIKPGYMLQGGIFGAVFSLVGYAWWNGEDVLRLMDAGAFAMPLGEALGRVGCHLYGCCWGRRKSSGWTVVYTHDAAKVCRCRPDLQQQGLHPAPLYATIVYGSLFVAFIATLPAIEHAGVLTALYLTLHPIGRVILERFRDDDRGKLAGGVTHSNAYSGIMFSGGVAAAVAVWTGYSGAFRPATVTLSLSEALDVVWGQPLVLGLLFALSTGAFMAFGVHYKQIGSWLGRHEASPAPDRVESSS